MVIYDFACSDGHAFEGWFSSLKDCNDQLEAAMVRCPVCDSAEVVRQPVAAAVHVHKGSKGSRDTRSEDAPPARPLRADDLKGRLPFADSPEGRQSMLRALTGVVRQAIAEQCEDVGPRFCEEAIAIHSGERDHRNIVGTATPEQEETLDQLGVEYQKLVLPKFDD